MNYAPSILGSSDFIGVPTDGQVVAWDQTSLSFRPITPSSGGAVTSVAGRTGAITLAESDITNLTTDLSGKVRFRGIWNSATAYVANDVVIVSTLSNQAYICLAPNTNDTPPSGNWQVLGSNACTGADQQFVSVSSNGTIGPSGFDDANFLSHAANLSDLPSASTARTNLGLGSAALKAADNSANNTVLLDGGGKIPSAILPSIAIGETFPVASQAAMLALTAQINDSAIRSDDGNHRYLLLGTDPTQLSNWIKQLTTTDAPVQSVNSATGNVVLTTTQITEGTNLYFTTGRASSAAPVQSVVGRTGVITLAESDITGLVADLAAKGTVSSVGLTTPFWLTVASSPVTSIGTLAVTENAPVSAESLLGAQREFGGL